MVRRALALLACAVLSSCGGDPSGLALCFECMAADRGFYALTAIVLDPSGASIRAGNTVTSDVTLVYPSQFDDGSPDSGDHQFVLDNFSVATPLPPGISATLSALSPAAPCNAGELPPAFVGQRNDFMCGHYRLAVTAQTDSLEARAVTLSAQWTSTLYLRVIERIESFTAFSADTVGFELAVGAAPGGSYAVRTTLPVSIHQFGTAAVPVSLDFPVAGNFGLTGSFSPNPADGATAELLLNIPARYAEGGLLPLRIHGSGGGVEVDKDFTLRIEPLFTMTLTPASGSVSSTTPLDVRIDLGFSDTGPFAAAPPALTLAHTLLPPGTRSEWIGGATATAFTTGRTISRTLRISSDGDAVITGSLAITATAPGLAADLAGDRPSITRNLDLTFVGAPQWQFIENGASYQLTQNDVVGIAMNSTNVPVIAWLEGVPGGRKVYVKRFDGTTFVAMPSPGPANSLVAPIGDIDEARLALTRGDVAKVAFTFRDNAGIGIGSAGTSWTVDPVVVPGAPLRVFSPRIAVGATGADDVVALAYVVKADAPGTSSELFVSRSIGAAPFAVLGGLPPGGALNRDPSGRVLAGTPALAMRPGGHPVVAWIEEPNGAAPTPALWIRSYDGAAWGPAIAVPVSQPPVAAPVQLVIEPAGTVVVSWLDGSPAQLKVSRCDLASATCLAQDNTGNGQGSLNASAAESARDFSLALDSLGRIVVAWTEGGVRPQLRVKRQNADTTWSQVGSVIDLQTTRTPRIVGAPNELLYLGYTRFLLGDDLLALHPLTDIFVVSWPWH